MANKPKYFDIEDSITGKTYRVETDAEDATYEEAAGYLESLPEDQWTQYEYNPSVPSQETPQQAPAAPVRTGSVAVSTPKPVTNNLVTEGQMGADTFDQYSNYEIKPLSPEEEAEYVRMSEDSTVPFAELKKYVEGQGMSLGPDAEENLIRLRTAIAENKPVSREVAYERLAPSLLGEYTPELDPTIDSNLGVALEKGMAYSPMGVVTRMITDFMDGELAGFDKDTLRQQYPDLGEEQIEDLHDSLIGEMRRRELINANYQVDERKVPMLVDFFGDVVGGSSPIDFVPIGRATTFGGKLAESAVENVIADSILQAGDIAYGAQQRYDPLQGGMAALSGAALQAGISGTAKLGSMAINAATRGSKQPASGGAITVPTGDRRSKASREGMATAVQQANDHVAKVTEGWTNSPKVAVHGNFTKLKGVNNKAQGVFMEDGSIALNLEQISKLAAKEKLSVEEVTNSVIFHESLGHFALNQEYGATLDDMLDTFYSKGTTSFQRLVDEWMDNNPKQYLDGDPRGIIDDPELYRRVRATEEVMAKWAEDEGVIPKKYIDTFINMVKDFLRRMDWGGYQPAYSPREVKSLLAVAQEQVTRKPGTDAAGPGSPRYMYIGGGAELDSVEESILNSTLSDYQMYLDAGYSPEDLMSVFGPGGSQSRGSWFIGPDNEWRYEISDHDSEFQKDVLDDLAEYNKANPGENKSARLDEVLEHRELFKKYPELADYKITYVYDPSNPTVMGWHDAANRTINISPTNKKPKSTLIHEVQHAVQRLEGFAVGGSPERVMDQVSFDLMEKGSKQLLKALKADLREAVKSKDAVVNFMALDEAQAYRKAWAPFIEVFKPWSNDIGNLGKRMPPEMAELSRLATEAERKLLDKIGATSGDPEYRQLRNYLLGLESYSDVYSNVERLKGTITQLDHAIDSSNYDLMKTIASQDEGAKYEAYQYLLGEVEARDTQKRMMLWPRDRFNQAPYSSEPDLKPENFIISKTQNDFAPDIAQSRRLPTEEETTSDGNRYMMVDTEGEGGNKPFIDPRRPVPVRGGINNPAIAPVTDDDAFELQSAQDILLELTEGFEGPARKQWSDTKRDRALAKGITAKEMKNLKGVGDISLRLYQYEALQQKLSDRVIDLYYKMQTGGATPQIKAQYLETMYKFKEIAARIFEDQAEVGRALNFMKNLNLTRRKVNELNDVLREYNNGVSAFASDDFFQEFAERVQYMINTGNPAAAANIVKQIDKPYWWQYILSARHGMMLSGLGTHAKNAYDGLMMIAREMEETTMALPLFYGRKALKAMGKDVQDGVSPQEVTARAYGLMRALLDSGTYKDTAKAFWEGHQSRSYSAKIEMQDARIPALSKVNDALYASDTFFRAFHMNANLYTLGVRKAREDGFTGMRALEEGTANAMNPTKEMLEKARNLADVTLLVDSPSALGNMVEPSKAIRPGMKGGEQAKAFAANMLFPFLRVTDRLLFQAIRRSPLSFLDKNTRAEWAAGGAERDIAIARTVYGSALMAYYWQQAGIGADQEGDVEGAGPPDYKKAQSLEATGYRPNSEVQGNKMVDITALNLSMNPLGTDNNIAAQIASIREAWERGKKGETEAEELGNQFTEVGRALLGVLASQSYAENLSTFIDPLIERDPARKETAEAAFIGGIGSQFVLAAGRQFVQQRLDPERKVTRGDGSFADRIYGRIASGIPGLSETLPDRVDALGDTMPQGRTTFSIGNYTEIKQDDVSKEIRNIERNTKKPLMTTAPSSFELEGRTVRLTAEQQQKWNSVQGRLTREVMSIVVADPGWKKFDLATKVEFVKQLRSEAYEAAKMEVLPDIDFEVQLKEEEL